LQNIQANFCHDAFTRNRKDTDEKVVQVASFSSIEKAQSFREFISNKIGSGEVGQPTLIVQPPEPR